LSSTTFRDDGVPVAQRQAIAAAARALLARDGWRATTTEAIAARAGVRVGTVRAVAPETGQLLLSVLLDSSAIVAAALSRIAERHLRPGRTDAAGLAEELTALAHAWLSPTADHPEHFAIVRRLAAEITELPPGVVEKWQTAGPRQAQGELAGRLAALAEAGLLDIGDPLRAAGRFITLTTSAVVQASFHGALPLDPAVRAELVSEGVADFLRLYRHPAAH
jgi:AcrR family transcriptional regulator